ncbi:MAG: OmpA family protein [Nitrospiraceae bacterium]
MGTRSKAYVSVVSVVFLLGSGCAKSIETNSGSDQTNAGLTSSKQRRTMLKDTETDSGKALRASAGTVQQLGPRNAVYSEAAASTQETASILEAPPLSASGFPSLSGAAAGVAQNGSPTTGQEGDMIEDIVIAKAEPADVARRQAEGIAPLLNASTHNLKDVFFTFDSWSITEEGKQTLSRDAEWLKANTAKTATIEGHCDERGTSAYNLVLGEKRAKAVKKYLTDLGVNSDRLAAVSYGKERLFCTGQDEMCHEQNRRGHLIVQVK